MPPKAQKLQKVQIQINKAKKSCFSDDILKLLLEHVCMNGKDVAQLSRVCRQFFAIFRDEKVWQQLWQGMWHNHQPVLQHLRNNTKTFFAQYAYDVYTPIAIAKNAENQQLFFNYAEHWAQKSNGIFMTGVAYCQKAAANMEVKLHRIKFVIEQCLQSHDNSKYWASKKAVEWIECSKKCVASYKSDKFKQHFGDLHIVDADDFLSLMTRVCGSSGAYNSINVPVHCANVSFCAMVGNEDTSKSNKKYQQVKQIEDWTKDLLTTANNEFEFFEYEIAQNSELKFFMNVAWDSALVMISNDGTLIKFVFATDTD